MASRHRFYLSARSAFSLIELSVVIVILSSVAVLGLETAATFMTRTAYQTTLAKVQAVDEALIKYRQIYGRLPCPGDRTVVITDGTTHGGYGQEYKTSGSCDSSLRVASSGVGANVFQGMVPVRALNLPLSFAADSYGNRLNYFVTNGLTVAATYSGTTDGIEVRNGQLEQPCTSLCQPVSPDTSPAAYFVFSNGYDKRGGITPTGTKTACLPTPTASYDGKVDSQNCYYTCGLYLNCSSASLIAAIPVNVVYDSRYNRGTVETNYFDDITAWHPKNQL